MQVAPSVDFINLPFPPIWQASAFALLMPALVWAIWTARWGRLEAGAAAHVWYGTILCLTGLWGIRASLVSGVTFHLLGASLFVLLAGPRLALVGTALVVAIVTALRDGLWSGYALNTLVTAAMPIAVTTAVLRASERWLPRNPFVYIFVVAFFGSALGMLAAGCLAFGAAVLGGAPPETIMLEQLLPLLINLAFGEATVTGMVITLLVVYRPTWVATYEEARYLRGH
jgi:uncharacterized membrane protein